MVAFDALTIDWEVVGEGEPAVCLVHPLGMERGFWGDLLAQLVDNHRCLLVDLPGHGRSPLAGRAYSVPDVADTLAGLLTAAVDGPVHLVGASMGGMVGLALAARHPGRVRSLVLADSTARYSEPLRQMWGERAEAARSSGMEPMVDHLLQVWFSPEALEANGAAVEYVRGRLTTASSEAYARACEALAAADLRDDAASIKVATLVVAGDHDLLADDSRWLAETIPSASLRWLRAGRHGAPLEMAGEFASLVTTFLKAPSNQDEGPGDGESLAGHGV